MTKIEYKDQDDGSHFYSGTHSYEWWYFDGQFESGYSCAVGFHLPLTHVEPHFPAINISIQTPSGEDFSLMKPIDVECCSAAKDRCNVRMGEFFAKQISDDSYHVFAKSKKCGVDLYFHRKLPGWKPVSDGYLYNVGEEKHHWVVPVPKAEVEGKIYVEDKEISVKGLGYHDHNWGNVDLHKSMKSWMWGRFHHEKFTAIYYCINTTERDNDPVSRLYLANEEGAVLLSDIAELSADYSFFNEVARVRAPGVIKITAGSDSVSLCLKVENKEVASYTRIPNAAPWLQHYWRFVSKFEAKVKKCGSEDNISGACNSEYILLANQE